MLATLTSLRIKNLALVELLDWQLAPGFIAVTGETGAGKSVIIGALKLLLGERAEKSLIRTGADSCTVEACFAVEDCDKLDAQLDVHGLELCDEGNLIIKRSFTQAGSNRQFINGSPTTVAVLKQLGDLLVDLHGPHDHQSLLSAERQLDLLDAYSHAVGTRRHYEEIWRRLGTLREEHAGLATNEAALDRELELLRHQAEEIQSADLRADEEDSLQTRYALAANSRRLIELATGVAHELTESEPSIRSRLGDTARLLRELEKIDSGTAALVEAHTSAVLELEEVARGLVNYAEKLDLDPAQLAEMEERVNLIQKLKRKYGPTLEQVIASGEEAAVRLQKIEGRGAELERLQGEIDRSQGELMRVGRELSALRMKAAPLLSGAVREQLRDLGFKKSEFEIHLLQLETPGAKGLETIEFVFRAPLVGAGERGVFVRAQSGRAAEAAAVHRVEWRDFAGDAGGQERAGGPGRGVAAGVRRDRRQRRRGDRPRGGREDAGTGQPASGAVHHAFAAGGGGGAVAFCGDQGVHGRPDLFETERGEGEGAGEGNRPDVGWAERFRAGAGEEFAERESCVAAGGEEDGGGSLMID